LVRGEGNPDGAGQKKGIKKRALLEYGEKKIGRE